jgi:hypothetical protein
MPRRLVVFGPVAQAAVIVALLVAAVAFAALGMRLEAGLLVTAIVSRMLPVARGRPGDIVRVVTRGTGAQPRRAPTSPSPPPPPKPGDTLE